MAKRERPSKPADGRNYQQEVDDLLRREPTRDTLRAAAVLVRDISLAEDFYPRLGPWFEKQRARLLETFPDAPTTL